MIKTLITEFPLSDLPKERTVTEEKIRKYTYTKEEVKILLDAAVKEAVDEARKIDEESMAKHNRDATVISISISSVDPCQSRFWGSTLFIFLFIPITFIPRLFALFAHS